MNDSRKPTLLVKAPGYVIYDDGTVDDENALRRHLGAIWDCEPDAITAKREGSYLTLRRPTHLSDVSMETSE